MRITGTGTLKRSPAFSTRTFLSICSQIITRGRGGERTIVATEDTHWAEPCSPRLWSSCGDTDSENKGTLTTWKSCAAPGTCSWSFSVCFSKLLAWRRIQPLLIGPEHQGCPDWSCWLHDHKCMLISYKRHTQESLLLKTAQPSLCRTLWVPLKCSMFASLISCFFCFCLLVCLFVFCQHIAW